jgi:hypothetical protein
MGPAPDRIIGLKRKSRPTEKFYNLIDKKLELD